MHSVIQLFVPWVSSVLSGKASALTLSTRKPVPNCVNLAPGTSGFAGAFTSQESTQDRKSPQSCRCGQDTIPWALTALPWQSWQQPTLKSFLTYFP